MDPKLMSKARWGAAHGTLRWEWPETLALFTYENRGFAFDLTDQKVHAIECRQITNGQACSCENLNSPPPS